MHCGFMLNWVTKYFHPSKTILGSPSQTQLIQFWLSITTAQNLADGELPFVRMKRLFHYV